MLQVIKFEQRLNLRPIRESEFEGQWVDKEKSDRASSADKWLSSLQKTVILPLANFSRAAAWGLVWLLRSGNFTPDQARPGTSPLHLQRFMQHSKHLRVATPADAVLTGLTGVLRETVSKPMQCLSFEILHDAFVHWHFLSRGCNCVPEQYCCADNPGKPTKGEMAKSIRLLIGNARDDEQLFDDLGRHW